MIISGISEPPSTINQLTHVDQRTNKSDTSDTVIENISDTSKHVIEKEDTIHNLQKKRKRTEDISDSIEGSEYACDISKGSYHHENQRFENIRDIIVDSEKEKENIYDEDMFAESDDDREDAKDALAAGEEKEREGGEDDSFLCPVCFEAR